MKQVADMVEPCNTAADVGCDHGYVSIYLAEQGIVNHMIAMDVRTGPLSRARTNVAQRQMQDRIQCRLSDGLEGLAAGEADIIVMAGMGGPLMIDILERGREKYRGTKSLVLQPQSDIPEVRRYLHRIGWEIVQEEMLYEDGKYYTVLKAKHQEPEHWNPAEYQYGKRLLRKQAPVLRQYLEKEQLQLEELLDKLQEQKTEKAIARIQVLDRQLEWNREARKFYEVANDYELA